MPISLRRKPLDIAGFHLTDANKMVDAHAALQANGWRGAIIPGDEGSLRLELNADNPTRHIVASIGDWLVDDMGWRLVTAEECAANYDMEA